LGARLAQRHAPFAPLSHPLRLLQHARMTSDALSSPLEWTRGLARAPELALDFDDLAVRAWRGTEAVMMQPRLHCHYVVLHLGGAKRVTRHGDGQTRTVGLAGSAVTTVPAGSRFRWTTEGPIAFAHLYIPERRWAEAVEGIAGRDARVAPLIDRIGLMEASARGPFQALLAASVAGDAEAASEPAEQLLAGLLRAATVAGLRLEGPIRLPRARLRRVLDLIEAELQGDLSLTRLAAESGLSRFHFARAFRAETGASPHQHVRARRLVQARRLLAASDAPVEEVARRCGWSSHSRFAATFRAETGVSPSQWRAG
jgi:AraC family transcriptional regulator